MFLAENRDIIPLFLAENGNVIPLFLANNVYLHPIIKQLENFGTFTHKDKRIEIYPLYALSAINQYE